MVRRSKILGVPRLRRKLKRIDPGMRQEIPDVIGETLDLLISSMRAAVPVSATPKGRAHLRDLLTAKIARTELSGRAGLLGRNAERAGYYWRFVEFGTVKMPARPFVRPAILEAEQAWPARIRAAVDKALERAARSEPIGPGSE